VSNGHEAIIELLSHINEQLAAIRGQLATLVTIAMLQNQQERRQQASTKTRHVLEADGPSYLRFALPDGAWLRVRLNSARQPDSVIIEDQNGIAEQLDLHQARHLFPDLPIWGAPEEQE
jgi:hypothetical protein